MIFEVVLGVGERLFGESEELNTALLTFLSEVRQSDDVRTPRRSRRSARGSD